MYYNSIITTPKLSFIEFMNLRNFLRINTFNIGFIWVNIIVIYLGYRILLFNRLIFERNTI